MSMILRPHIYSSLIEQPYNMGFRQLDVITGFASSSFIYHVVHTLQKVNLNIIIGMAQSNGVYKWDHTEYKRISETTGRLNLKYYLGKPPIHIKGLMWNKPGEKIAYAGSSNFSWNGFRDYQELMTDVNANELAESFPATDLIDCFDSRIDEYGFIIQEYEASKPKNLKTIAQKKEFVEIPLFSERYKDVPERSGLNWGQRPEYKREPNQAYIPVPKSVHDQHPDFFPDKNQEFNLITDDNENFICVMAQDQRKAIETRYDNSELGKYFRKRLGIELGSKVTLLDLTRYGRKGITIYKLNDGLFFLDFSAGDHK